MGGRGSEIGHRRDDSIVCAVDQIVQITRRDGSEYGSLGGGIFVVEHIQGPILNGRTSEVRVMEINFRYNRLDRHRQPSAELA
jgi:hypothetical protein